MRHVRPGLAVALCVALATACGGGADEAQPPQSPPPAESQLVEPTPGGTLRLSVPEPGVWLDLELTRCCLGRTLVATNGQATGQGGTELRPDLAIASPTVSPDGLAWTFRLRPGVRYSPPFDDVEITTPDVIRSVERSLASESYFGSLFTVIEGAEAFRAGTADSVAGLEAPDPHTLVVHLARPTGDVAYLFAFPDSSPTPPGADEGHASDYAAFFAASGPYMYEGADGVDYTLPAAQQTPARGAGADGNPMVLIRNPSWDRSGDPLRPAYPDRIEISFGDSPEDAARGVDNGTIDMVLDYSTIAPASQIDRYQADEELQSRVHVTPNDSVSFLSLNVAAPPFDDVHVRRAINLALDKQALRELTGGAVAGAVATHVAPDSLEGNLLLNYDPYPSEEQRGDIVAAKDELSQSRYDADGNGVCDANACQNVSALARSDTFPTPFVDAVARSLDPLGITLRTEMVDDCCSGEPASFYSRLFDPESHIALALGTAYSKDFTSASSFFERFSGASQDISLLGATKEQLEQWGYAPIDTPSVDPKIEDCLARLGGEQTQCWAELDQELMEIAVPLVPWLFGVTARVISDRVHNYTIDQWSTLPAFDRIALEPGAQ